MLASAIFKRTWMLAAGEETAPKATDADRRWWEVLAAAALQGAIFAVVKAAAHRAAAVGTQTPTGTWPGDEGGVSGGKGRTMTGSAGSWVAAGKRSVREFRNDILHDRAAALTYYGIQAIFPALLVLVSLLGLLGKSAT